MKTDASVAVGRVLHDGPRLVKREKVTETEWFADVPEPVPEAPRLPSMTQRSRAEVYVLAHVLGVVLGRVETSGDLSEAMVSGDDAYKSDGFLEPINTVFEYDDTTYHDTRDIGRDLRKTTKLLAHDPTWRVLRIRVGRSATLLTRMSTAPSPS